METGDHINKLLNMLRCALRERAKWRIADAYVATVRTRHDVMYTEYRVLNK